MTRRIAHLWRWLRRLSGDDAYEQYVAHLRVAHPGQAMPGRAEFYRQRESEKWSGVQRCC
jgi:uncharacterized short protein YbdD (DUF466 family)